MRQCQITLFDFFPLFAKFFTRTSDNGIATIYPLFCRFDSILVPTLSPLVFFIAHILSLCKVVFGFVLSFFVQIDVVFFVYESVKR